MVNTIENKLVVYMAKRHLHENITDTIIDTFDDWDAAFKWANRYHGAIPDAHEKKVEVLVVRHEGKFDVVDVLRTHAEKYRQTHDVVGSVGDRDTARELLDFLRL